MKTKTQFVILLVVICCAVGSQGIVQPPLASFSTPQGMVREDAGMVEVCVDVSNPNNLPAGGANVTVSVSEQGLTSVRLNEDYRPMQQTMVFTNETASQCVQFELIQDNLVENDEPMLFRVASQTIGTVMNDDLVTITIIDSDNLRIGFTQPEFSIQETAGTISLCAQLEDGQISIERSPVSISLTVPTNPEKTATVGADFMQLAMEYQFTNNSVIGSQECADFLIIDDNDVEANETFTAQLNQPNSVIFSQQTTTVTILDNEAVTVALDTDQIIVAEGNSTMNMTLELNVVLTAVPAGDLERDVVVSISIYEITATGAEDFILQANAVTFTTANRMGDRLPVPVVVLGDNFIEMDEVFAVNISTIFPDMTADPSSATVTITRDGDNICPTLENPVNGNVSMTNNTIGSIATYSCLDTYRLIGPMERNCTLDAGWSGEEPQCLRICGGLTIENGYVDVGESVEGSVAMYSCDDGFSLYGGSTRVCQSSGQWNGTAPTCQRETEPPTNTPPVPTVAAANNNQSVGIGVGVTVAILVVIAIVIAVVVVILVLFKISKSRKRYIVNEGAESNSSSTQKTQVTEITFEDASTLNRYLPEEEEEEEVPVVNGGGGSKENLLEESDNAPETLCTDC